MFSGFVVVYPHLFLIFSVYGENVLVSDTSGWIFHLFFNLIPLHERWYPWDWNIAYGPWIWAVIKWQNIVHSAEWTRFKDVYVRNSRPGSVARRFMIHFSLCSLSHRFCLFVILPYVCLLWTIQMALNHFHQRREKRMDLTNASFVTGAWSWPVTLTPHVCTLSHIVFERAE